ncbi:hypothetical protein OH786_37255 (plasmid) [Streptomyces atratus]|uniref:Chromosome partitioning protein, ParB family n=1 Tax=Streptomyces atratus TaxID=1893 RepID=A0A1K2F4K7_STRAR|nr:hypothetical protein [Streptomyces atratus]SFY42180.1 chromosome partitioning protein, ParB family [Streptomyces atratus]
MAAGRRTSLASLAGQKVDDVPGRSDPLLLKLPLTNLVPTRFNPRRNFGTDEDLKAFGLILKRRQLQPAVVVSRSAYLRLWPEEEENLGSAQYVIANGERRFRGSLAVGLTTLNVVHNEDVAKTRADFLDAVLSENNDREDLDPIERALGIETMVIELGGADKVAAHYQKSKGWVSQQRKLLKLTPELQGLVSAGELPIRVGRDIAGLPAEEQAAAWSAELESRDKGKQNQRARTQPATASQQPMEQPRFTAVNQSGPESTGLEATKPSQELETPPATPARSTAPKPDTEAAEPSDPTLPEPRRKPSADLLAAEHPAQDAPKDIAEDWQLPPGGWEPVFDALMARMGELDRHRLTKRLHKVMEEELATAPQPSSP